MYGKHERGMVETHSFVVADERNAVIQTAPGHQTLAPYVVVRYVFHREVSRFSSAVLP